ncbi:hypothetical protein K438DRAFT_1966300 [Mycena galopus ATCC 62051]|nr:hypothetical protein K438DRAFT_1966300 [Mycena galopus ATCC 62051]
MLLWKDQFSAWVTIDGKDAIEYDVQTSEDNKTVTCWIASELGKIYPQPPIISFIRITDGSIRIEILCLLEEFFFSPDVGGFVKVDGNELGGTLCAHAKNMGHVMIKAGAVGAFGTTVQPFVFSSLQLTDDDDALPESTNLSLEDLGVIELTIYPVTTQVSAHPIIYTVSDLKVHERSKKAVTQKITLAAPEPVLTPSPTHNCWRAGPNIVKFCFVYRPLDVLRADGIAPALKRKASTELSRAPDDSEEPTTGKKSRPCASPSRRKSPGQGRGCHRLDAEYSRSKEGKGDAKRPFVSGEVIDLT